MSKRMVLAVFAAGFLGLAGAPAFAQATDTVSVTPPATEAPQVDRVDRAANGLVRPGPGGPGGGFRAPEGVAVVSPAALVLASFDANHDGKISPAEIEAGAALAFAAADKNGDGAITGFEQSEWAASMSGMSDILSNQMTFDQNLDNSVSKTEFVAGFKRIAASIGPGDITFAQLVRPLNKTDEAERGPGPGFGTLSPRASTTKNGPPRGGGPNGGPNAGGQ